jgi:hypothetical protein
VESRHFVPAGRGLVAHELVPLQVRFSHSLSTQVMAVPMQPPVALHLSPYVHAFASVHEVPAARYVVPPAHTPELHLSFAVQ